MLEGFDVRRVAGEQVGGHPGGRLVFAAGGRLVFAVGFQAWAKRSGARDTESSATSASGDHGRRNDGDSSTRRGAPSIGSALSWASYSQAERSKSGRTAEVARLLYAQERFRDALRSPAMVDSELSEPGDSPRSC